MSLMLVVLLMAMLAARDAGFRVVARIDVGKNPHQISFSPDGRTAYVAAAGSDQVTRVDARSRRVLGTLKVPGCVPLGVVVPRSGRKLLVSCFGSDRILRWLGENQPMDHVVTGGSPSLLVGPYPGGKYLVSAEKADRLWVLNAERFVLENEYPTGSRPFPPSATSDGHLAFVPNYNGGTVTVVDVWNHRILATVKVGERPSGGAVIPGDREYAVAIRGEDRIAFLDTASHEVVGTITEGIGKSPFSVVVSPAGRVAFVNNTASHDISVVSLAERRVVARIPVGEIPIVMAVHPSGKSLWVSSEGSHEVSVIEIPRRWR
jgi:YVTN family beta-propeller protein